MLSFAAIAGFIINIFSLGILFKLFAVAVVLISILLVFKSKFGPVLATSLVPIITNTKSPTTMLIILAVAFILYYIFKKLNLDRFVFTDFAPNAKQSLSLIYCIIVVFWLMLCFTFKVAGICAVPPVLVIFFELIHKKHYPYKLYIKHVVALTLISTVSVVTLLYFKNIPIVLLINFAFAGLFLWTLKLHKMIPAYALCFLPMLFPAGTEPYFPQAVFAMATVLFGINYILKFKETKALKESAA